MTNNEKLERIFKIISENGILRNAPNRFGGMWSSDTWDLHGNRAQLCDDGATQMVGDSRGTICWSTMGNPVVFWTGRTDDDLALLYSMFFPEVA